MPEPRRRPFTLLDAVALVAAIAVALAWFRVVEWYVWIQWGGSRDMSRRDWVYWKEHVIGPAKMATPFAAVMAPTLLALCLRGPRPPLWRLARQPGVAACLATSVALADRAIRVANSTWIDYLTDSRWYHNFQGMCEFLPHEEGLAVAVAWVVLGVAGCLRPEPTWLDRAGRALGGFFLACVPLYWVYYW